VRDTAEEGGDPEEGRSRLGSAHTPTQLVERSRASRVNDIDETSWLLHGDRQWLWVMAHPLVASFQIHPTRSKGALTHLIADWTGILVSDGDLVYQSWQGLRQSGLAHLMRTAQGLAERVEAGIARCGVRRHAERQRLCHMGTERPTVGQGRAWYARFRALVNRHATRGGQSWDVCPAVAAGRRGTLGVAGGPGCGSHA